MAVLGCLFGLLQPWALFVHASIALSIPDFLAIVKND